MEPEDTKPSAVVTIESYHLLIIRETLQVAYTKSAAEDLIESARDGRADARSSRLSTRLQRAGEIIDAYLGDPVTFLGGSGESVQEE